MATNPITHRDLARALLDEIPELQPVYDEHMDDNYGDFLSHVFFADVTRFVSGLLKKRNGPDSDNATEVLIRIVNFCEKAMGSEDEAVQNIISLSFLENIDCEDFDVIYPLFGPNLRSEWEVKKEWEVKHRLCASLARLSHPFATLRPKSNSSFLCGCLRAIVPSWLIRLFSSLRTSRTLR